MSASTESAELRAPRPAPLRPAPISGFPELLPEQRAAELAMLDRVRAAFERHGFCSLETPAVERLEALLSKGADTDHEIYAVERLAAGQEGGEARFGLHYDLTVPLARYVAQHFGALTFPFKRYQIQHCWRGERPQDGRFRQFLQCDIDVVGDGAIPLSFDVELPALMHEVLSELQIGAFALRISNRKILDGYLEALAVHERGAALRWLDKLDKLGEEAVCRALCDEAGLRAEQAEGALALARISSHDESFAERVRALGARSERLELGLEELAQVMRELAAWVGSSALRADLSLVRGFDYYTGTVYELQWSEFPGFPSIGGGGRYDDLASSFTRKSLPGVGISLGFSRIFHKLAAAGRLPDARPCPTQVLVTWLDEAGPARARAVASALRARGIATEVYHERAKLKKQLQYADRKRIPYVWLDTDGAVKDMRSSAQIPADPQHWTPA
jgi:histidyl-tRNA synthetase